MIARRATRAALVVGSLALAACPGETDPSRALATRDFESAERLFRERAAASQPGDPAWLAATIGHLEALAHLDGPRAAQELRASLEQHPELIGEKDFALVADALTDARAFEEAKRVLEESVARWPVSPLLDHSYRAVLDRIATQGTESQRKSIEGIGYTGDSKVNVQRPGSQTPQAQHPKD